MRLEMDADLFVPSVDQGNAEAFGGYPRAGRSYGELPDGMWKLACPGCFFCIITGRPKPAEPVESSIWIDSLTVVMERGEGVSLGMPASCSMKCRLSGKVEEGPRVPKTFCCDPSLSDREASVARSARDCKVLGA